MESRSKERTLLNRGITHPLLFKGGVQRMATCGTENPFSPTKFHKMGNRLLTSACPHMQHSISDCECSTLVLLPTTAYKETRTVQRLSHWQNVAENKLGRKLGKIKQKLCRNSVSGVKEEGKGKRRGLRGTGEEDSHVYDCHAG